MGKTRDLCNAGIASLQAYVKELDERDLIPIAQEITEMVDNIEAIHGTPKGAPTTVAMDIEKGTVIKSQSVLNALLKDIPMSNLDTLSETLKDFVCAEEEEAKKRALANAAAPVGAAKDGDEDDDGIEDYHDYIEDYNYWTDSGKMDILWAVGNPAKDGIQIPHIYVCPEKFWVKNHALWDGIYPKNIENDFSDAGFVETAEGIFEVRYGVNIVPADFPARLAKLSYVKYSDELQAFVDS